MVNYLSAAVDDLSGIVWHLQQASPSTIPRLQLELEQLHEQLATFPFAYQATSDPNVRRYVMNIRHRRCHPGNATPEHTYRRALPQRST